MHHSYDFGRNFLDKKKPHKFAAKKFSTGGVGDPLNRGYPNRGGKSNQGGLKVVPNYARYSRVRNNRAPPFPFL